MTGNPKTSAWYSTPNDKRKRPRIELTLSPEALARLDELAKKYGSRSAAVERLIGASDEHAEKPRASKAGGKRKR